MTDYYQKYLKYKKKFLYLSELENNNNIDSLSEFLEGKIAEQSSRETNPPFIYRENNDNLPFLYNKRIIDPDTDTDDKLLYSLSSNITKPEPKSTSEELYSFSDFRDSDLRNAQEFLSKLNSNDSPQISSLQPGSQNNLRRLLSSKNPAFIITTSDDYNDNDKDLTNNLNLPINHFVSFQSTPKNIDSHYLKNINDMLSSESIRDKTVQENKKEQKSILSNIWNFLTK